MNTWTRRDFLKSSILTGSAAIFAKGPVYGAVGKGGIDFVSHGCGEI